MTNQKLLERVCRKAAKFKRAWGTLVICVPVQQVCNKGLVRMRGLEPPHPRGYMILSHARLPVPPHPHFTQKLHSEFRKLLI